MSYGSINSGSTSELTERQIKGILSLAHPVGSLYISDDATSPAELFGGTWERIEGRMIMGASDSYPVGTIGGSATHTQTVNEIASHYHRYSFIIGDAIPGANFVYFKNGQYSSGGSRGTSYDSSYATTSSGTSAPMDILNPYYSSYI